MILRIIQMSAACLNEGRPRVPYEETEADCSSLCLQGVSGESVWVICVKVCASKAYPLTKRQLISAQRKISHSVLIKEISPAQRKQTEERLFTNVLLDRMTVLWQYYKKYYDILLN